MTIRDCSKSELEKTIRELAATEILVETNEGTYGATEAHRAIGVGDPQFANYRVYETVDGFRRVVGCEPDVAPGRPRRLNDGHMTRQRAYLAQLRKQLKEMKCDPDIIAWRTALAKAGLTQDDIKDCSMVTDQNGRAVKWLIMLMSGRRYQLMPNGTLTSP